MSESLITYCCLGIKSEVERMLSNNADIEEKNPDNRGITPLIGACENDHYEIVKILTESF